MTPPPFPSGLHQATCRRLCTPLMALLGAAITQPAGKIDHRREWGGGATAGLVGRGSIVARNTFYRIMGWQVPANMPEPDYVDVTPVAPNEAQSGLDEEMLREIGRYGLKNTEFRNAIADGLGRRMNDWLNQQGRPPIDAEAVQSGLADIFTSMSNRG